MKNRDIARAALAGSIVAGCAFSFQAATTEDPNVYDSSVAAGIAADVATAGLGVGLVAESVAGGRRRRPTVRRKPRTKKS